jgi:hypothetical protein
MIKSPHIKYHWYNYPILIIVVLGNSFSLSAQNHIAGKIVDEKHSPIEYANIILLNPVDSAFIDGTISSQSGTFQMDNISQGLKTVKISYLGYLTKFLDLEVNENQMNLGEVILSEDVNLLDEVLITTSVPLFSRKNNHLIVNVENSLLSSVGMANDVIKRIPGVSVQENEITVFSKGSPIVYINNRKIYDKTELQRLQSTDIATIELITNPGAKYDAEGAAILLIKTKKNTANGWAIRVSERLRQRKYLDDTEDLGLNYTHDNLSLFASYNHSFNKNYWTTVSDYTVYSDTVWQQLIRMPQTHKSETHQITEGMDWSITPEHAIGWQYQNWFENGRINSDGQQDILVDNKEYDRISTGFNDNSKRYSSLLNAFYIGHYGKSFDLRFDMDYMNTQNKTGQQIREFSSIENRDVTIQSQSDIRLYAGKGTMEYHLGKNTIELGGEYNQVGNSGFLINPESYIKNSSYTNDETKAAGFINYNRQWGKLTVQFGIRYDLVHIKSTEDSTRQVTIDRRYQGLYPNVSLSQTIGNTQMGLTFSRKIQRPAFALLSNNDNYINRFLQEKGNPYLQPETVYRMDYLLKYRMFDLQSGYIYRQNPVGFTMESVADNPSQTVMTYINYPKYQELNVLLTTNFEYKIWQSQITAGLRQPFFALYYLGEKQNRNQLSFSLAFTNEFVFPKDYIFSLNFAYQSKETDYMNEYKGNKKLDIGIRKSFYDKKLFVNLQVNDLFDWVNNESIVKVNTIRYLKMTNYRTRSLILTVSYQLNNYKKKYRGENAAKEDMKRL